MTERTKYVDIDQIYKLCQTYAMKIGNGDIEGSLSCWQADGIQMIPNEARRVGWKGIGEALKQLKVRYPDSKIVILPENINVLGRWAFAIGTYTLWPVPDKTMPRCKGEFLSIFIKQHDGSWKIFVECRHLTNHDRG